MSHREQLGATGVSPAAPLDEPYLGHALFSSTRRGFLGHGAVLGASLLVPLGAGAQAGASPGSEVHDLRGNVKVNGVPATYKTPIKAGDTIVTGSDGYIVFVVGNDAYMLRSRSELVLAANPDAPLVATVLTLLTGALGVVFQRKGPKRRLSAGTATAGIRGTGVYVETRANGTYFCTCWGQVDLAASEDAQDQEAIESRNHTPRLVVYQKTGATRLMREKFETHNNDEMDILAKCLGRRSPILRPEWFDK